MMAVIVALISYFVLELALVHVLVACTIPLPLQPRLRISVECSTLMRHFRKLASVWSMFFLCHTRGE